MAYQLQEINRSIRTDVAEFLAECDQSYAQRVSLAADRILGNLDKSPIVLLSGPSGSPPAPRRGSWTMSPPCAWTWTCWTGTLPPCPGGSPS